MKRSPIAPLLALLLSVQSGCDKKDGGQSGTAKGGTVTAPASGLPAECQDLMTRLESLQSCGKIPQETRTQIVDGYKKMIKVMTDSSDPQMGAGCKSGSLAVEQTIKTAGC